MERDTEAPAPTSGATEPLWGEIVQPATPSDAPTVPRPDWNQIVNDIGAFWPKNKFDGKTTAVRLRMESQLGSILRAAKETGHGDDPGGFLTGKARAYCDATEPRYTVRFSRFLAEEYFARDWEPEAPAMPKAAPTQRDLNKIHNAQVILSLMTPEERAAYDQGKGALHAIGQ